MDSKVKSINRKWFLLLFMLAVGIVRVFFLANLPIDAHPSAAADDGLLYKLAKSLVAGEWLGEYCKYTMVKGPGFSFFLAACNLTGIPYLVAEAILYNVGCILITASVDKLFKNNFQSAIFYLFILFNPIATADATFQKVYRNGIVLGLELMVIAFYIMLYLNRYRHADWILAVVCSIAYAMIRFTKNDYFWIVPFMVVASVITIVKEIMQKEKKVYLVKKAILLLCPFLVAWGLGTVVSMKNEATYGIYGVTDSTGTNYAKALGLMYSIECDTELQRVSITREKLEQLYQASPTLESIRDKLSNQVAAWTGFSRDESSGEIEGQFFSWALRIAVEEAGYYTDGDSSEAFYGKVYDELSQAVEDGTLKEGDSMPSVFMQPWKKGYGALLVKQMFNTNWFIISYENVVTYGSDMPEYDGQTDSDIEEMAEFCHSNAIYGDDTLNDSRYLKLVDFKAKIINSFTKIWSFLHPVLWMVALFRLIYLSIQKIRKRNNDDGSFDKLIIAWGLLLTYLVIIAGVSYTEISDFAAITYKYLSPAYPVIGTVEGIILLSDIDIFSKLLRRKGYGNNDSDALPE